MLHLADLPAPYGQKLQNASGHWDPTDTTDCTLFQKRVIWSLEHWPIQQLTYTVELDGQ